MTEFETELPSLPNFIKLIDQNLGASSMPIESFSKEELEKIGEEWKLALIKKAGKK